MTYFRFTKENLHDVRMASSASSNECSVALLAHPIDICAVFQQRQAVFLVASFGCSPEEALFQPLEGFCEGERCVHPVPRTQRIDRKSTRRTPVTNAHLVCRHLLEK